MASKFLTMAFLRQTEPEQQVSSYVQEYNARVAAEKEVERLRAFMDYACRLHPDLKAMVKTLERAA